METIGRRAAVVVCAVIAVVGLVYGINYLTEGSDGAAGSNLGWAALFGVSAVLLWRRVGRRRASVAFGLLVLGLVVLYIVLVELHNGGTWPFSVAAATA